MTLLTTDVLALVDIDDQEGRCIFAPAFFVALVCLGQRIETGAIQSQSIVFMRAES